MPTFKIFISSLSCEMCELNRVLITWDSWEMFSIRKSLSLLTSIYHGDTGSSVVLRHPMRYFIIIFVKALNDLLHF